jgi:hypothetical protein
MQTIRVPYGGKEYKVSYKTEMIHISFPGVPFINVYSVFIDDPELKKIASDHFTILYNQLINPKPGFDINDPGNVEEMNLKKEIAQQVINNPDK